MVTVFSFDRSVAMTRAPKGAIAPLSSWLNSMLAESGGTIVARSAPEQRLLGRQDRQVRTVFGFDMVPGQQGVDHPVDSGASPARGGDIGPAASGRRAASRRSAAPRPMPASASQTASSAFQRRERAGHTVMGS